MATERCPGCKAVLPDDKHTQDSIRTEGGRQIPVIICPFHPPRTMTLGMPELWDLPDAPEPPVEGAPIDS